MAAETLKLASADIRLVPMSDKKHYFLFRRDPAAVLILPAFFVLVVKLCAQQADEAAVRGLMAQLDQRQGRPSGEFAARFDTSVAELVALGVREQR